LQNGIGLRLSERRPTNIGPLYPKVRNNTGGIFIGAGRVSKSGGAQSVVKVRGA